VEVIRRAAGGERGAQREFLRTSYPDDVDWQAALQALLNRDPPAIKDNLLSLLPWWYDEVIAPREAEVMRILVRDAEAKRGLLPDHSPEDVIERATQGFEYVPEPGIKRVLLIPALSIRPWVHSLDSQDLKIFCYPVSEESITGDPGRPPLRLLKLTRALGDERRLEILRLLASGRYTLQEVADQFGVAKTTIHHHLAILRSAGLIRLRTSDRTYTLRLETLATVSELLTEFLKGDQS
jgi:DNA-binding transcriptional ArsR family regulator